MTKSVKGAPWKHVTATGPWASEVEYLHKKATAQAQWEKQKIAKAALKEQSLTALALPVQEGESAWGVDIGEGSLTAAVSMLDMIKALQAKDMGKPHERRVQLRRVAAGMHALVHEQELAWAAVQAACRELGDGSEVAEGDGTRIVRCRTEARVAVRAHVDAGPEAAPAGRAGRGRPWIERLALRLFGE